MADVGKRPKVSPKQTEALMRATRDIQELWLQLAPRNWKSMVVVPVEPDLSAAGYARSVAEVGASLGDGPVTFVNLEDLERAPNGADADRGRARTVVNRLKSIRQGADPGQLVLVIQSVMTSPMGVLIARAADVVVLCVQMERTQLKDVRRTVELIGQDRIVGCLAIDG